VFHTGPPTPLKGGRRAMQRSLNQTSRRRTPLLRYF
jgi:hypothetical protein